MRLISYLTCHLIHLNHYSNNDLATIKTVNIKVDIGSSIIGQKTDIINTLTQYNESIPLGMCIVNFGSRDGDGYYSGAITQKINDVYGIGMIFSYYNISSAWIRLEEHIWKE